MIEHPKYTCTTHTYLQLAPGTAFSKEGLQLSLCLLQSSLNDMSGLQGSTAAEDQANTVGMVYADRAGGPDLGPRILNVP